MRHEKASRLLELARLLASTAEGLTLDEMAERMGVGRRTVERMRDAIREVFPQLEEIDDPPTRRFRLSGGLDSLFQTPDADELAALRSAAETLARSGAGVRAEALRSLEQKVMTSMRQAARRKVAPDMEALVQAETIAAHAGPRPFEDPVVLGAIRGALKGLTAIRFRYEGGSTPGREREVTPYGVLFGRSNYLVGAEGEREPQTFRLDRMREVEDTGRYAPPPEGFSIQDYAASSFGIYHDAVEDVILRIDASRAEDALNWRFHPSQTVKTLPDGRIEVAFTSSGMRELAWHLFTWGGEVEIVAPARLKSLMVEELEAALARHRR